MTAGIVNHKREDLSYRVEVNVDGIRNNETGPIVLGHEEKWEGKVSFALAISGEKQKVDFVLYKERQPYNHLYLWVDLTQ
ncbi:DUF1616 domain-containing protein [Chloroflexota bacterium]